MNCLVYVHAPVTGEELADEVATMLGADERGTVPWAFETSSGFYVSVRENELADDAASREFPNGFINFPMYVEVTGDDDSDAGEEQAAVLVGKILRHFWDRRVPAIAECAFAERLPLEGGYGRSEAPWPAPAGTSG